MKRDKNIFWGLLFLLGAVALIIGKMGYLQGIGFWSILFSIGLLGILLDNLFRRSWGGILFSLAFLAIVNSSILGIEKLTPWTVLGAAFLGTIGLNIIFPPKKKWNKARRYIEETKGIVEGDYSESDMEDGSKKIHYEVCFGSTVKYLKCDCLKNAHFENVFGSLGVYFMDTMLKDHTACIDVEVVFGTTELYIPAEWSVECNASTVFGKMEENGHSNSNGVNVLTINGEVCFGKIKINYI